MKIIEGDVIEVAIRNRSTIVHQVNCKNIAGAGLALQIRQRFPQWYATFSRRKGKLGDAWLYYTKDCSIASLYAQAGVSRDMPMTDYEAFKFAAEELRRLPFDGKLFIPYGIGCGLAGGSWPKILQILEEALPDAIIVRRPQCHNS